MKKISVLGSTGSIGTQCLDIIRYNKDIEVVALAAGSNIRLLKEQIKEFTPRYVSVSDEKLCLELKKELNDESLDIGFGKEGLIAAASYDDADIVLSAVVGMIGIEPTIAAIKSGKDIALANKETIVCAGHIIMQLVKDHGVNLFPVDSEHSAIFQCLDRYNPVHKILLTASGGPFRGYTSKELENVTLEQALKHPNWSMGKKITIDSSTMVNKGLEVIEAKHLFNVDVSKIEVLVQPTSIIHSMVEFEDGAVIAQMGVPDMKLPIQYALYYPERKYIEGERLDFKKLRKIEFEEVDIEVFEGLKYAYEAAKAGGSMPAVYNIANEYAVALFLEKKIAYKEITRLIKSAMDKHNIISRPSVAEILEIEEQIKADFRRD